MKAGEAALLKILEKRMQFVVPIYQRTYSWTRKQCEQLWDDIVRAGTDETLPSHFLGSIVYVEKKLPLLSEDCPELLLIDGQQRMATVILLLSALATILEEQRSTDGVTADMIRDLYLFNQHTEGEARYKLILTRSDKDTLIRLLEGKQLAQPVSKTINDAYQFYKDKIKKSGVDTSHIYLGAQKLLLVDISLNREYDNPQLIFESLNSTGLELSQADLIRNYILMGLEPVRQEELYRDYWFPMEQDFRQSEYVDEFDYFVRDWLTIRLGRIPVLNRVYEEFKAHIRGIGADSIEEVVSDTCKYSKYYSCIALGGENDLELRVLFHDINSLKVNVAFPLILELYDDYTGGRLRKEDFLEILRLIESYVFRRSICGIPTNSLNKTFAGLIKELDKDNYLESFKVTLLLKDGYRRFPSDTEFTDAFVTKDCYSLRTRNYLLRKLENHERKELVSVENYTIEHIMPQNENLSREWQDELGEDWKEIRERYLHTLGNLTLTGYNSKYSDKPFREKRDMDDGFRQSPIGLNASLKDVEDWNKDEIRTRTRLLAMRAVKIWECPRLEKEILDRYRKESSAREYGKARTLEDHEYLKDDLLDLFYELRRRILNLDASVTETILSNYIAYKTTTNFVDVSAQKKRLRMWLNMEFNEIRDPKGVCKDVTNVGRWGNGDVEVYLSSRDELDYVMFLIQQSFNKHSEHGEA